jgi:DNA-binding MarR family transcriptional regulator
MLRDLRRDAQGLTMTPIEHKIVGFLLFEGFDLRWTTYIGGGLTADIGNQIEKHKVHVSRGLVSLEKRGWVRRGTNDVKQTYAELTTEFMTAAKLAQQRLVLRRTLGPETWKKCNGDDEIADLLHERAMGRGSGSYKDRVRAVADVYIDGIERGRSRANESLNGNQRIVDSRSTNRRLVLIAGERKSGA